MGGSSLWAQDFGNERVAGKVLLLKNGQAMEGDIEKLGADMRIRRGASEVRIAADRTARLCADWNDAYAFVQTLIKTDSAGDRVWLARWCHLHRLNDKALLQARKALEIEPDHREAKQIVALMERAKEESANKPVVPSVAAVERPSPAPPTVDVTSETLIAFTTKVQPILMNACANCHAAGIGGKFQLERVSESGQKYSTQRNLAAVLGQIDLEHPAISPLLVKAITRHGDAKMSPLKDRSAVPFVSIRTWIEQAIARNPQLKDYAAVKEETPAPEVKSAPPAKAVKTGSDFATHTMPNDPARRTMPLTVAPVDDYSPEHFNRHFHPEKSRQQTAGSRQGR